jgi:hypothetical protein
MFIVQIRVVGRLAGVAGFRDADRGADKVIGKLHMRNPAAGFSLFSAAAIRNSGAVRLDG